MNQEQLRKEAAEKYAKQFNDVSDFRTIEDIQEYASTDFIAGAEWEAERDKWIELPIKERFLTDGLYLLRIFQPDTKVEDFILFKCNANNRIINYHYATHYVPLNINPPKTSK